MTDEKPETTEFFKQPDFQKYNGLFVKYSSLQMVRTHLYLFEKGKKHATIQGVV